MRKARLALWLLAATAAMTMVLMMTATPMQAATPVQMAVVQRGNIRQTAALSGRVAYRDEWMVYAVAPGFVEDVCVQVGDRVAKGDALIRLQLDGYGRAASAWAAGEERLRGAITDGDMQQLLDKLVIRAPVNGNVRQVLAARSGPVSAGMPVMMLSSAETVVRCLVAEADMRAVRRGMQAELALNGDVLMTAEVTSVGEMTSDPMTGRLQCPVTLTPQKPLNLPAGTAVDADVCIISRENVPVLPVEAVTDRGTVWWVHEGRCTEIPAEIVLSDELYAWVALPEGLQVAIGELQEGQRVTEVQR